MDDDAIFAITLRCRKTRFYAFEANLESKLALGKAMESAQTARKARKSVPTGNKKISVRHNRLVDMNEPLLKRLHGLVDDFPQLEGKLPFFPSKSAGKSYQKNI